MASNEPSEINHMEELKRFAAEAHKDYAENALGILDEGFVPPAEWFPTKPRKASSGPTDWAKLITGHDAWMKGPAPERVPLPGVYTTNEQGQRVPAMVTPAQADRGRSDAPELELSYLTELATTQTAYGEAFAAIYGARYRYVAGWGAWITRDGTRWVRDTSNMRLRDMAELAKAVRDAKESSADKAGAARAVGLLSHHSLEGALKMAAVQEGITIQASQLDSDAYVVNTPDGLISLRAENLGEAVEPTEGTYHTKMTRASSCLDPGSADARFQQSAFFRFLNDVLPDFEMQQFARRVFGHALLGVTLEQRLTLLTGVGGNGKSTLVNLLLKALGDYADTVDPELLMAQSYSRHPTALADLHGLRLAVTTESDAGRRLDEGTVKRITGGDVIKARRMNEDFWSFIPSHSLFMQTNHLPTIQGTDEGIWRRILVIDFPNRFVANPNPNDPSEKQADATVEDALNEELDIVFDWLLDGLFSYYELGGLCPPEAAKLAVQEYREQADDLAQFIGARCMARQGVKERSQRLYDAWKHWSMMEGIPSGSQKGWAKRMQAHGFSNRKSNGVMVWHGICLLDEDDE